MTRPRPFPFEAEDRIDALGLAAVKVADLPVKEHRRYLQTLIEVREILDRAIADALPEKERNHA